MPLISLRQKLACLATIIAIISASAFAEVEFEGKSYDYTMAIFVNSSVRFHLFKVAEEVGVLAYRIDFDSTFDPDTKSIKNVKIYRNQTWEPREIMPAPDVWYDYSLNNTIRSKKAKARATALRQAMFDSGIKTINPKNVNIAANKLTFAKMAEEFCLKHPRALDATSENILQMARKYSILFFKERNGNQGDGVLRLEKENRLWSIEGHYRKDKAWHKLPEIKVNTKSLSEKLEEIKITMGKADAPYLIQQGIDVFRYEDQLTYFRVYMQRGIEGVLSSPIVVGRIGGKTAHGGRVSEPEPIIEALAKQLRQSPDLLFTRLHYVGEQAFQMIERKMKTTLGELTMDVVIDTNGDAYVLEANIKPGQLYFKEEQHIGDISRFGGDAEIHDRMLAKEVLRDNRLMDYGRYLANTK